MPKMPKIIKTKKFEIHWTHLIAVIVLVGYFFVSKINMIHAISKRDAIQSFLQLYLFGVFFACLFLFIFSHEKFFPFAKDIEKNEQKNEKKYIKKYLHHGKVLGTFLIGAIGGPVFSSLTARMFLNNFRFKYLVIILANIPSTLFTLGVGWGILRFV